MCGRVHRQCFCLCVRECTCECVCLKCAAAKSDRTQAHISLPRKRYKATHTHTGLVSPLSLTPYLSNSVSSNSFCLKLSVCLHTHIHKHTCSPRLAKRERWLVNKQWHSAHSVTRLGFDQHRCSCSPQQCFLSFLPAECCHARALPCTHTPITSCLILIYMGLHILSLSHFLLTKSLSVSFCPSNSHTNIALS